jgi:hypothetical protein
MADIAGVLSHTFRDTRPDIEILKAVTKVCGVVLAISMLVASYGLDLSAGFF